MPLPHSRLQCRLGNCCDFNSSIHQFTSNLQIQRSITCNQNTAARRNSIGPCKGLSGTCSHKARQGPTRHRIRSFVGTGSYDQLFASVPLRGTIADHIQLLLPSWLSSCIPNSSSAENFSTKIADLINQGTTLGKLAVHSLRRLESMALGKLFKILPTWLRAFIQDSNAATVFRSSNCSREASGPRANNQHFR